MAPLLIAGAGLMATGQVMQGQAAEAEGRSAENIANYNAQVAEREAEAQRMKARFEQRRQVERGEMVKSSLEAKIAAAGGAGSPVAADLSAEQAKELELENLLIGYEGKIGAQRAESEAELYRLQGKLAKRKGKATRTASYIGAGGTLLSGFGAANMPSGDYALGKKHGIF